MCGIIACLSLKNENIIKIILDGLELLQNRGYDSAGISFFNDKWETIKYASSNISDSLKLLENKCKNINSTIAIGHTRWATHGAKNDINSHPHVSMNNKIILVHNGIISNFKKIKDFLISKNYSFQSETDTEVICNLIEYFLMQNNTISKAIELACNELEGSWALAIVHTDEQDIIYVTKHGSPLVLGKNENEVICTSEISSFNGRINNYIILNDNDLIKIDKNDFSYIKSDKYNFKTIDKIYKNELPDEFKHWTIKEIYEQEKTIDLALNNGARIYNDEIKLGGLEPFRNQLMNVEHIVLLACGTSYHACLMAKYYFSGFNTVQAFDGSEFREKDLPKNGNILAIFCSQSGETYDLLQPIKYCKRRNCILMGIINVEESLIAREMNMGVYLNAGKELAVPSTKSFTSMLIVLSIVAMYFRNQYENKKILLSLRNLSTNVKNLLHCNSFLYQSDIITKFINSHLIRSIFVLGRDKLNSIALEGALKIKEMSYIHAEGYSGGSLKHGPFAILDSKALVLLLIDEETRKSSISTFHEINSRNTNCFIITNLQDKEVLELTNNIIHIPYIKYYNEILFIIALQYISYKLAITRNINPDKPRNLAKVVTVA